MAARKLGKGSVVTTHSINYENSFTIRTMSRASYPYYRYHLTYPHRIIAVSKASREFIKRFTRVPVRIVPNGINIERFDIPVSKEEAKELLNLDGKVVLYVGRLEPRKGVGTLISAMKDVDGTLLVAGSGSMLPVLRNKAKLLGISNRVKFLGTVSYSILPYTTARVMFLFSRA